MRKKLWWLSFATDEKFLGGAFAEGRTPKEAIQECWRRGINPGGEVACFEAPSSGGYPLWRLLTAEEVDGVRVTDDVVDHATAAGAIVERVNQ